MLGTTSERDLRSNPTPPRQATGAAAGGGELSWCLDLLQPFGTLLELAARLAADPGRPIVEEDETGGPLLNLYLVACALDQILSDRLHRHFYDLTRMGLQGRARWALAAASRVQTAVRLKATPLLGPGLQRRERQLLALARSIAGRILAGEHWAGQDAAAEVRRLRQARWPARVSRARLKVPQSFRGVDLYPADCELVAERASQAEGDLDTPVLVVGLRTSGLYLAPFTAAALDRLGHEHVSLMTLRPGVPLLPSEVRRVRRVARAGGWALIVDDPSWRGSAYATARSTLTRLGFAERRVCLSVFAIANQPVFRLSEPGENPLSEEERKAVWPGFADAWKAVVRPEEWFIHHLLSDDDVEAWLNRPVTLARLGADRVRVRRAYPFAPTGEVASALTNSAAAARPRRYHVLKVFEIEIERAGERWCELMLGRGVGLGFFGYHSWLVAACLGDYVPEVLGVYRGVLFMRWQEGQGEVEPLGDRDLDRIASYVAARARRLDLGPSRVTTPESRALYTGARQVARLLSRSMGRTGAVAQFRAADEIARQVGPARHAVVDGRMGPSEWLRTGGVGLLKVDFEEHGFDITDRCTTDPAHDLASAVMGFALDPGDENHLLKEYRRLTGDSEGLAARLTVQKLQAGWAELDGVPTLGFDLRTQDGKIGYARELAIRETMLTRTVNAYLADVYLSGVVSEPAGPIWAIDLDDTLEADRLGFETISPAGALALRMLRAHGHQVFISTGRSLDELRERCRTYGLAGGVGEYGSVIWDASRGEVVPVIDGGVKQALARLRAAVLDETDVMVDPRYYHTLRLFRHTSDGRRGMPVDEIHAVMRRHSIEGLEVIEGFRKNVVWAAGVDKAVAFQRLRSALPASDQSAALHVIGDAFTDLALMRMADGRHAPGNAEPEVLRARAELGIHVARRRQQAGVLEIVQRVLHGRLGSCQKCRPPRLRPADASLVRVMSIQDRGTWGRMLYALHPASIRAFER